MKTCLIVDDSKITRIVLTKIVNELGLKTEEAANGQEAIDYCMQTMPDSILLDWNMPVKNGLEFLQELRATPGGDSPVVIFCTTEIDLERIRQAFEAGGNEYIMKPFDRDVVEQKFTQLNLI